jgi:hypothetical protein
MTNTKPSQIIRQAAEQLRVVEKWGTQYLGEWSSALAGQQPSSWMCAVGSLLLNANGEFEEAYEELRARSDGKRISEINNGPDGHQRILELFDRTADDLEKNGR